MAKQTSKALNLVAWLTGIIVALAVGFALTGQTLVVPYIPSIVSVVAGWIVVLTTLASAVMAVMKH